MWPQQSPRWPHRADTPPRRHRHGGYAELCLVPASHVFALPDAMSFEAAAVFPTCWMTAAHALFDVGKLQAGETVLIHAAGSGVSTAGIQLACAAGARVLATAGSDDKCARAEQLGAAAAANNRTVDIAAWAREATGGAGVESVFGHQVKHFVATVVGHQEVCVRLCERPEDAGMVHRVVRVQPGTRPFAASGVGRVHEQSHARNAGSRGEHRFAVAFAERDPVGVLTDGAQAVSERVGIPA